MTQAEAWIAQIESDFAALQRVKRDSDPTTYCQSVAKCQQIAEKSIKAMVAAINELGISFMTIGKSHNPEKEIEALRRMRRTLNTASLNQIQQILSDRNRRIIDEVCSLAPTFPSSGQPFQKNTEYPFQKTDGSWTAPAAEDSFSAAEVRRYSEMAWVIRPKIAKFVTTVRRGR